MYTPRVHDIVPQLDCAVGVDPLNKALTWHLQPILVQQEPSFKIFKLELGLLDMVDALPVVKTKQFPANAINADEGQNDGNWQVLESLLEQSSVSTEKLEESVVLIHGDLMTKERVNAL